jgi:hypothetical protein
VVLTLLCLTSILSSGIDSSLNREEAPSLDMYEDVMALELRLGLIKTSDDSGQREKETRGEGRGEDDPFTFMLYYIKTPKMLS